MYPLLTFKVKNQILSSNFSIKNIETNNLRSSYRGVLPFMVMNIAFGWALRPLFSQEKLEEVKEEVNQEHIRDGGKI